MAHLELIRPSRLTWWQRAKRSLTLGPWNPRDKEIARYFGGSPVTSGVSVNEDNVMSFSAVWSAVNLVSAHISSVPLVLYRVLPDGGKERFSSHPLYRLVHDQPNPLMGSALFRRTVQTQKMVWGEGFAEIERDGAGRPVGLWPLLTFRMHAFFEGNELFYRYSNPSGKDVIFEHRDILHIRAHTDNGIGGIGPVRVGRESFGVAIAAERQAAAFYGNGMTLNGSVSYPAGINLTPQAKEDNRKALEARHMGADRAYRLLTLYEGGKYEQLGVSPNEGQFLESRMFQVEEVARWFNIPPHKLKHLQRTSYNSIEHQSIEYVTDALDPDWVLWEQELNLKLVFRQEYNLQRIEHVREGMLRGDSTSRSELQSKQFHTAMLTPNEGRAQENRNPYVGGDEPFVSLQVIPMSLARPYWEAQIEKAKQPPAPAVPPGGKKEPDPERDERERLLRAALQTAEDGREVAVENARRADERAELIATAHTQDKERFAAEIRQLGDALAEANTSLHAAADRERALADERDEEHRKAVEAIAEADRWKLESVRVVGERDDARGVAKIAKAGYEQAIEDRNQSDADRDAALALAENITRERDNYRSAVESLSVQYAAADAKIAELRVLLDNADTQNMARADEREVLFTEAETLKTDLARARADIAAELDAKQAHKAALLAAMRSLFVDATERLLQKESDRARKHQTTAAKLGAWVETFYPMHVETVRHTFRPLVGAWTAVTGEQPSELLERLVAEHIDTSKRALLHVLDADDDDQRAATLERTLNRWETERAEAMADALVREGMVGRG